MDLKKLEDHLQQIHPQCFAWALRCCYENEEAAAEVLQNTYLKVLEGKARYQGRSGIKTWLFSVIRYTAIDHFRSEHKGQSLSLDHYEAGLQIPDPAQEILGSLEQEQHQVLFKRGLAQLSARQSLILHLVFFQDCSIQEAADIMEIQVGTARTHYERGKKQLKEWLIKAGFLKDIY